MKREKQEATIWDEAAIVTLRAWETTPCVRFQCPMRSECAARKLCCDAFVYYVQTGSAKNPLAIIKPHARHRDLIEYNARIDATAEKYAFMMAL